MRAHSGDSMSSVSSCWVMQWTCNGKLVSLYPDCRHVPLAPANADAGDGGHALIFSLPDNSCTSFRANCSQCYSNTGIPGRRRPRKETFAPVAARF
jgi:hypothetical protein